MSYLSNLIQCPTIQTDINAFGCDKSVMLKLNETGLVQFVVSPVNTGNTLKQLISPGAGKLKSVELVYTPRIKADDVATVITRESCVASTPHGNRSATYTLDPNVGVQIERRIHMSDLNTICKDNESYISEMLLQMMDAAIRKMDVTTASQAVLLAGTFGQGETGVSGNVKTVKTQRADGGLNPDFISQIDYAAENAGYCFKPFVLGWDEIYRSYRKLAASCCADSGINVAELAQSVGLDGSFIADRNVHTSLGVAADFLTIDPGAVQLLTFNQFAGYGNMMEEATFVQKTITHPQTGIVFDYQAKFDCGFWNFFISVAHKLVGVPTDEYFSGDIYSGTTGVNKFLIVNP